MAKKSKKKILIIIPLVLVILFGLLVYSRRPSPSAPSQDELQQLEDEIFELYPQIDADAETLNQYVTKKDYAKATEFGQTIISKIDTMLKNHDILIANSRDPENINFFQQRRDYYVVYKQTMQQMIECSQYPKGSAQDRACKDKVSDLMHTMEKEGAEYNALIEK